MVFIFIYYTSLYHLVYCANNSSFYYVEKNTSGHKDRLQMCARMYKIIDDTIPLFPLLDSKIIIILVSRWNPKYFQRLIS